MPVGEASTSVGALTAVATAAPAASGVDAAAPGALTREAAARSAAAEARRVRVIMDTRVDPRGPAAQQVIRWRRPDALLRAVPGTAYSGGMSETPGTATEDIRVLIADDQPLMSGALRIMIDSTPGLTCVGVAADGLEAVEVCDATRTDVVLMDMQMPRMDGVEATRRIVASHPETRVLAITTFSSEDYLVPALRAGAAGYLLKDAQPATVLGAVRAVRRGESVLSPAVAHKLIAAVETERPAVGALQVCPGDPDGSDLTPREREVLDLLARGRSNPEIAAELHVSESTVKGNLGRIMDKLEVRDRVQVIIRAAQLGLVTLSLD